MADPTPAAAPRPDRRWTIHAERLVDASRYLRLSIADIELPDGVRFEKYVFRLPRAAITVLLDDTAQRVLMIWRHRVVPDSWSWELPGGYVDPGEDPHTAAAREVEEETGWRPGTLRLLTRFQALAGIADCENLIYLAGDPVRVGPPSDPNEAERVEWIELSSIPERIASGEMNGAGTQIGLLHLLAFHRTTH